MSPTADRPVLLLFDVNETLLDLAPLRTSIERILPGGAELWFTTMLHYATAMNLAGRFEALPAVGAAALRMLAKGRGLGLTPQQAQMAVAPITRLPAHPDVAPALARLRRAGFGLAALSNSTTAGLRAQLAFAGLRTAFVCRGNKRPFPLADEPELVVQDLSELAGRLDA